MWQKFDSYKRALFKLCNGKEICLWGYGYSGRFIEHLFCRDNKEIKCILDDSPTMDCKLDVERSLLLKELRTDTHIVLCAFRRDETTVKFLTELGYVENESFVFVREWFYGDTDTNRKLSYYDYLEFLYGCDIIAYRMKNKIKTPNMDSTYYSPGIDYSIVDIIDHFEVDKNDGVFDFGCGKGGALLLFHAMGIGKIGGVEYDGELYQIALDNLQKMRLDVTGLINGDAAEVVEELDKYNLFWMYNPFLGKTFEHVVQNLEKSFLKKRRKMYVIYANPFCHEMLVSNGIFKFSKTIKTDYSVKNVRIYCTN
ncbi:MAG: class I SAM-dependent methyltransferase [Lachnospiraceae bacterium]|jgi:predicted RNA methylase